SSSPTTTAGSRATAKTRSRRSAADPRAGSAAPVALPSGHGSSTAVVCSERVVHGLPAALRRQAGASPYAGEEEEARRGGGQGRPDQVRRGLQRELPRRRQEVEEHQSDQGESARRGRRYLAAARRQGEGRADQGRQHQGGTREVSRGTHAGSVQRAGD